MTKSKHMVDQARGYKLVIVWGLIVCVMLMMCIWLIAFSSGAMMGFSKGESERIDQQIRIGRLEMKQDSYESMYNREIKKEKFGIGRALEYCYDKGVRVIIDGNPGYGWRFKLGTSMSFRHVSDRKQCDLFTLAGDIKDASKRLL